jgi:hypothetical protein
MYVDESGSDQHARGVDLPAAAAQTVPHGGDPAAIQCDIGHSARGAGAVDYRSIANDNLMHKGQA